MVGLDYVFYKLLCDSWLHSVIFPIKMGKKMGQQFFTKYADRIFLRPYRYFEEACKLYHQNDNLTHWFETTYMVLKTSAMEFFIDELLDYCFFEGSNWRQEFMLPDLVRSLRNDYYRITYSNNNPEYLYRDHILHSGYVFLWGLWLYKNYPFLQDEHKTYLETKPVRGRGTGCKALYKPNNDVRWQFFQQWAITSFYHDVGRFIENNNNSQDIIKKIDAINIMEASELARMKKLRNNYDYNNIPLNCRIDYDPHFNKIKLDLYKINYSKDKERSEEYIFDGMWEELLSEINKKEQILRDNHGIHSAKILLKLANFTMKLDEIYFFQEKDPSLKEPWKRNSFRNYILPANAISKHHDNTNIKLNMDSLLIDKEDVPFAIPINMFKDKFLETLLVVSDNLAVFDRAGGRKLLFTLDYDIEMPIKKEPNRLTFSIIKRKDRTCTF